MDIQFTRDGLRFNVRCSCIVRDRARTQVVLTRMRAVTDHAAYLLPGGRAELLEPLDDAVVRELREELGVTLDCRLVAIEENVAREAGFHMLEFVYLAEVDDLAHLLPPDDGWDHFLLADIADLDAYDIRPPSVKALIRDADPHGIVHHVNFDWR